ncbi:MAG TPA: RNA-guided endonuclease TnpB family protein, partial [Candidatus Bathyarchaeia archaeon]|nr:RNA-guided endonuclease TnpB family protein [Candidatus Bathyarchaeia archaeon]
MKTVRQKHEASNELLSLLNKFRRMVNECVAFGIEEKISSLMTLSLKSYYRLSPNTLSYYRLGAISSATGILRNYRKAKRKNPRTSVPYAGKLMLTTCYGFKIQKDLLRLPLNPRQYVYVKLNNHTLQALSGHDVRSVTLTPHSLSISYSRETVDIKPEGYFGIDRNLDNVTVASTGQTVRRFDMSKATRIKSDYRFVNSHLKRNDSRIRRRIQGKYGRKQRNRVQPLIHNVSRRVVDDAKTGRYGIVMERLTGIRRLYRKGNGQSRNYRARMNSWSSGELQRQVEYKARWEGLKVIYVPARNTSKRCSICGYKTLESTQRQLWCPYCGAILDRDENAAMSLAAGGLRFSPNGPPGEAVKGNPTPTVILRVDGGKLSQSIQRRLNRTRGLFFNLSCIGMSSEASYEMRLAILTDFDGTVTLNDTFENVLAEFAQGDWRVVDEQYVRGEIGLEECLRRQGAMVR